MKIRAPKTVAQATALLERVAALEGQLATLEGRRGRMIARANASVDAKTLPLLEERAAIVEQIEPWWATARAELLAKDRKSIELGGCMIGNRLGGKTLAHDFPSEELALAALRDARLGKQTIRVAYSVDKTATRKLIEAKGATAVKLKALGFRVDQPETFFLERAQQGGTVRA